MTQNLKHQSLNTLITDNLDIWTSAIKSKNRTGRGSNKTHELYGIKKLRELILDLAVRGLLVPQDPNDEPASVLLEKIKAEKEQLIKVGKIKKQKALPEICDEEKPFDLPQNWIWTRFGSISDANTGFAFKSSQYVDSGIFVLRVINIDTNGKINHLNSKYISKDSYYKTFEKFGLTKDDLLLVMVGGSLGKIGIVSDSDLPAVLNQNMWKLNRYLDMPIKYLKLGVEFINRSQIEITKSTHGHLSQTKYLNKLFPLPPLKEQKRIVTKVDELMALCDQLEQQTENSIEAHKLLVENLLNALTQAKDHETFQQAWQRIAENFDSLFTTEHSIDQLKQTILQLAVMGKLVPQNPNDEPASELLKKIAAEKEKLIKEGKIKKQKPLPEITEEEKPFELPEGWEWVRFGNCISLKSGKSFSKSMELEVGEVPYCKVGDMNMNENTSSITTSSRFINPTFNERLHLIPEGSIIFPKRGGAIATNKKRYIYKPVFVDLNIMAVTPYNPISLSFVMKWLDSFDLATLNSGTSVPQINNKDISPLMFPCPPCTEQKRIVTKSDELMVLCDKLKSKITNSKKTQTKIADSLTQLN